LVVTKLKRFSPQDKEDIQFLCDEGHVQPDQLRRSLELALQWTTEREGDPDRERAFAHLDRVIAYLEGRSRTL
jgi:hypothetical protein